VVLGCGLCCCTFGFSVLVLVLSCFVVGLFSSVLGWFDCVCLAGILIVLREFDH